MLNPVWIKSFIEVANRSSMAAAARTLKITPAAISKHIQSLENELGIPLFKRSTRRLDLTSEGLLYLEHAKRIINAYHEAESALSHTKEEPTGTLKIIAGPQVGNLYIIPYLKEFLKRYPKIRLNIEMTQTIPDVEKEKADVVIGLSQGLPSHWIQRTLTHARWIFVASPRYLKEYGFPKKPSDLAQHQIITRSQRDPNNLITFKSGEKIIFEPYLYFNDTRAIRRALLSDLGIAQLHDYIIADDLKENRLVEILHKYVEGNKTIPIHIAYAPSTTLHLKIRRFIDYMIEVIKTTH